MGGRVPGRQGLPRLPAQQRDEVDDTAGLLRRSPRSRGRTRPAGQRRGPVPDLRSDAAVRDPRRFDTMGPVVMGDLVPPDPPLAGAQAALRPFRVSDAAAISESCRDPDIPRFTMMPEAMTEDQARQWVERGLESWPRGLARFAVTVPPSDECAGQIGVQFDFANRRAEAFYWLDRRVRGRGIAVEVLDLVTEWAFRDLGIVRAPGRSAPAGSRVRDGSTVPGADLVRRTAWVRSRGQVVDGPSGFMNDQRPPSLSRAPYSRYPYG